MNTFIETLNHWSEIFLNFAGPMLWQSSLLITVVFALDCVLARKIRPAVRHALWMVVLVKLLLPPALALPTGAAWWLWPTKPPLTPVIKAQTVAFDTAPLLDFTPQTVPIAPPTVRLNGAVSAALLAWLVVNWLKVARKTRRATASGAFDDTRQEAQHLAGLHLRLRLRLVDDTLSPAVYGLFRPVILLPRALTEKLSAAQLRAVLLHEAIHVRRGDVWVNCAQTLLQIAYWWHPLLWLANARIRRLREEAVDDAVMLALRADAPAYAPTLLEVAKFAFRRPLTSLGLVGILESRSKLRQRIERLVNFRPPRKAGVTALSLCGIFAFSAVALPMGQAPVSTTDSVSTGSASPSASVPSWLPPGSSDVTATMALPPPTALSSRTSLLIEGRFFWVPSRDVETLTAGLPYDRDENDQTLDWRADAEKLKEINQRIHSLKARPFQRPRIQTSSGGEADMYVGNRTNWIEWDCTPFVNDGRIVLDMKTVVGSVSPLDETNHIEVHGHATLENNGGMILSTQLPDDSSSNLVLVINAKIVQQKSAAADPPGAVGATNKFEMRTFKVDSNKFRSGLKKRLLSSDLITNYFYNINIAAFRAAVLKETGKSDALEGFKEIAAKAGMDLSPPEQVSITNERFEEFCVVATGKDMGMILNILYGLHCLLPQIHIKARFIEIPQKTFAKLQEQYLQQGMTNGIARLTNPQFQVFLHSLKQQKDVEELAEPEVTTLPGRQTQMRSTVVQPIITGFSGATSAIHHDPTLDPQIDRIETAGGYFFTRHYNVDPQVQRVELGPILDVIAKVLPDGYTIDLTTIPSLIKFFGYADTQGLPPHFGTNYDGQKIEVPIALPAFGIAEERAEKRLYDTQTLVLLPKPEYEYNGYTDEKSGERIARHIREAEKKEGDKVLIVLVTATLIDAVGNRIHSDAEMAFAQTQFPPPWP